MGNRILAQIIQMEFDVSRDFVQKVRAMLAMGLRIQNPFWVVEYCQRKEQNDLIPVQRKYTCSHNHENLVQHQTIMFVSLKILT